VFRTSVGESGGTFDRFVEVRRAYDQCREVREGVGRDGAWAIDYHTRLDMNDAVALSTLIEPLRPYFSEDLVRSENPGVYRTLRGMVKVPIAVGEQFGTRWDQNELPRFVGPRPRNGRRNLRGDMVSRRRGLEPSPSSPSTALLRQ
jgi:galactonate dehydratase